MKTENEQLKEIFEKNLGKGKQTPDFELMWQEATQQSKKKTWLVWKIAASIALLVAAGTIGILNHQHRNENSGIPITSWHEPTEILIPSQRELQSTSLAHWTSPTSFLLPGNKQPIK